MKANNSSNSVKINKSDVMRAAWAVLKRAEAKTFAEALKMSWKAFKLKAQMAVGHAKFKFRKANGEIREAFGTLANNMYKYDFKGTGRPKPVYQICFFDLIKKQFRSFTVGSLL